MSSSFSVSVSLNPLQALITVCVLYSSSPSNDNPCDDNSSSFFCAQLRQLADNTCQNRPYPDEFYCTNWKEQLVSNCARLCEENNKTDIVTMKICVYRMAFNFASLWNHTYVDPECYSYKNSQCFSADVCPYIPADNTVKCYPKIEAECIAKAPSYPKDITFMRGKTARPTTQSTITSITILDRSSLKTTSKTVTTSFETTSETLETSETTLEITNETPEARSTEATTEKDENSPTTTDAADYTSESSSIQSSTSEATNHYMKTTAEEGTTSTINGQSTTAPQNTVPHLYLDELFPESLLEAWMASNTRCITSFQLVLEALAIVFSNLL